MSLPTINIIYNNFTMECVAPNLGQNNGPYNPVHSTSSNNTKPNHAMQPVRQCLVDAVTVTWRHKGSNDKVHIAEEEEDHDREGSAHGRVPVVLFLVQVDPRQTCGDKDVDDGERVRDDVENKVVRVARRRRQHDNDRDEPVFEQTRQRRIEWAVAGPQPGPGQDALAAQFLYKATLGEDDAEDVAEGGERDEDGQSALCPGTEDIAEQRRSDEALGGYDLLGGDRGEVRNVYEHVQHGDGTKSKRCGDLERAYGVFGLAEGVVGVAVANIAPDDVVKRCDDTVRAASGALEGVIKIVRLVDLDGAAEGCPARDHNQKNDEQLDDTEQILKTQAPLQSQAVNEKRSRDACKAHSTLIPAVDFDVGGVDPPE